MTALKETGLALLLLAGLAWLEHGLRKHEATPADLTGRDWYSLHPNGGGV